MLPTHQGKLVFVRSYESNEFWSALLEKAYAKLYGGYDQLDGGWGREAFSNFTGGVTELYDLKYPLPDLYKMMLKSFKRSVLMDACVMSSSHKQMTGLVGLHAYSITKVVPIVNSKNKEVQLLRVRNPHGNDGEWKGAWNDQSSKWQTVSKAEKNRINFREKKDGEFYIEFHDFLKYFDKLEICNLSPDLLNGDPRFDRDWKEKRFDGANGENNGHIFSLIDPDEDDDEDFCTIVISLLQIQDDRDDQKLLGFNLYKKNGILVKKEYPSVYSREHVFRYNLEPGQYKIVANSKYYDDFAYCIRIFYEVKLNNPALYPDISREMRAMKQTVDHNLQNEAAIEQVQVQPRQANRPRKKNSKSNCVCSIC